MKAARIVAPKKFEFVDAPDPVAKDGQVLIRLEKVSVCGSDIRHGYGPIHPEEEYPMPVGRPCHECAGVVVESRTDRVKEGQRVIVIPPPGTGGLQQFIAAGPERLVLLPDTGPLDEWVMCQPTGTVMYACQRIGSVLGKKILVLGQGSIGLSFTMLLARQGASAVIAADLYDYRLEKARQFGATHTINPDKQDLAEAVNEITKGRGADVVVEAAGYPDTFNLSFQLVRQFGIVCNFGIQSEKYVPLEHNVWMDKQPTIIPTNGARSGDPVGHMQELVGLRLRGWIDPGQLLTHRLGFSDVQTAYDMYEQRKDNVIKVVMDINK